MDDPTFDHLHDEPLSHRPERAPGTPDPRLSRRRLLGGAGSGFVLAASRLLVPAGVAGKDRNEKDRNRKDQDEPTSPNALKHFRFEIANYSGQSTSLEFLKRYYDPYHNHNIWIAANDDFVTQPLKPNERRTVAVEETFAAVALADFAIIIDNPAFGAPEVYFRRPKPPDPSRLGTRDGNPSEGESIRWEVPGTHRVIKLTRKKDTGDYKEYLIELMVSCFRCTGDKQDKKDNNDKKDNDNNDKKDNDNTKRRRKRGDGGGDRRKRPLDRLLD